LYSARLKASRAPLRCRVSLLFNVGIPNEVLDGLHILIFKDCNGGHWSILLGWLNLVSLFSKNRGKVCTRPRRRIFELIWHETIPSIPNKHWWAWFWLIHESVPWSTFQRALYVVLASWSFSMPPRVDSVARWCLAFARDKLSSTFSFWSATTISFLRAAVHSPFSALQPDFCSGSQYRSNLGRHGDEGGNVTIALYVCRACCNGFRCQRRKKWHSLPPR
jgi:hypothetical protein